MAEPATLLALTSAGVVALLIICTALLRGWIGWLEVKRLELETRDGGGPARPQAKLELAELKERVRKLEGIASGIE